jgi:hypothetical protein
MAGKKLASIILILSCSIFSFNSWAQDDYIPDPIDEDYPEEEYEPDIGEPADAMDPADNGDGGRFSTAPNPSFGGAKKTGRFNAPGAVPVPSGVPLDASGGMPNFKLARPNQEWQPEPLPKPETRKYDRQIETAAKEMVPANEDE